MGYWTKEIPRVNELMQSFGHEDGSDVRNDEVPAIATALVELLDRELPEYMEMYGESLREMAEEEDEDYMSVDEFDYELNGLYDYADYHRIWLGI